MNRNSTKIFRRLPLALSALSLALLGLASPVAFAGLDGDSTDAASDESIVVYGEEGLASQNEKIAGDEPREDPQVDLSGFEESEAGQTPELNVEVAPDESGGTATTRTGETVYEAEVHGKITGLPKLPKGESYEMSLVAFDPSNPPTTAMGYWQDVAADGSYKATMLVPQRGTVFAADLYRRDAKGSPTFLGFLKDKSGQLEFTLSPGQTLQRDLPYKAPSASLSFSVSAQTTLPSGTHWPAVEIYQQVQGQWLQVQSYYTLSLWFSEFGGAEAKLPPGTYAVRCMTIGLKDGYVQPGDVKKSFWWNLKPTLASSNKITLKANQTYDKVSCDMKKSVYVPSPDVKRLAGANRFATSVAVSKANYSPGVPVAFVAYGMGFPDALSGAPAASKLGGPVLLTQTKSLPSDVRAELVRLKPKKIVVLGGKGVVSDSVMSQLKGLTTGGVERWSGSDRYGTAVAVSREAFDPGVPVAFIAYGRDFPDALSGAPAAAKNKGPILLVEKNSIPASVKAELQRLQPGKIVVLGGKGVVSESVRNELAKLSQGGAKRWSGTDRFATSASISSQTFAPGVEKVYIANGAGFPDALAGGPVAGKNGAPILLVRKDTIPDATQTELKRLRPKEIVIIGGTGVVSRDVEMMLADYTVR